MTARRIVTAVFAVPLTLVLAACSHEGPTARWSGEPSATPAAQAQAGPVTLAITPASSTKNLPVSTEITTAVQHGTVTSVAVVDDQKATVGGAMRPDGSAWVPDRPLKYRRTYTATVTATGQDGTKATQATTFSTMAEPGGGRVGSGLYLFDGITYGVAMPVVVEFDEPIPQSARAAVERRMFVTTVPPQPGAWGWFGDRQVMYRGPTYWQPGTKLTVRTALEGLPIGNRYGDTDRRATGTIRNDQLIIDVDNTTKQMTVTQNGQVLKKLPVSLGKKSTPSSSGTMVIMDKQEKTVFDTRSDPDPANRYVVDIEFAQRLTWGGEYIHSAPWSVGDQGRRNVSHGCVNVSAANASWLYGLTRVGDPVTVRGTEEKLESGNGWTAWDVAWPAFLALSALPHPELVGAVTTDPNRGDAQKTP